MIAVRINLLYSKYQSIFNKIARLEKRTHNITTQPKAMHYAPPESRFDDEEAQTLGGSSGGSRGSSSRKSRSSRGNSRGASKTRRNNNNNNNNTRYQQRPPQHHHQQQQKMVQKNLGKFIKRSFAKPKPGPHPEALRLAAAAGQNQQQSQTSTAPQIIGENSYLLPLEGGLINCRPSSQYGDGDRAPLTSPAMSYMTVDSHTNDPHTNNMQYPSHASVGSGSASTGRRSSKGLMSSITHKLHRQSQQQQQQQPSSPDRSSASAPTRGSTKKKHFRFFDDHHEYPTDDEPPSISTMEAGSWHDHHTGDDTHSSHHDDDDDDTESETEEERALRIARAQDEIRSHMSFSVGHCLMAIFVYVVLSIVCFSFFLEQEWTFLTSSYFAVVTFTTIGYGDVVPDTMKARLFTCVWSISGVAFLGIALGVIGSNLIEGAHEDRKKAQVQRQSKVIGLFDHYDTTTSTTTASHTPTSQQRNKSASYYSTIEEGKRRVMFDQFRDSGEDADDDEEGCQTHCSWAKTIVVVRRLVLVALIAGILYALSVCEKWNLVQTVYYAIITGMLCYAMRRVSQCCLVLVCLVVFAFLFSHNTNGFCFL